MKKLLLTAAAVLAVAAAWGADLNPAAGTRAGGYETAPANTVGGDNFKILWDNADAVLNGTQRNNISTFDTSYYDYPNDNNKAWVYLIVRISTTSLPDSNLTCYWRAWTANNTYQGMTIWRWDHRPAGEGGQRFVNLDAFPTGVPQNQRGFSYNPSWFKYDGETGEYFTYLLLQGKTAPGARWMRVDVVDIHY